jgi:hypothetical protein
MTVQGTGDFEAKWARCEVRPAAAGSPTADDILVQLTEQVGREMQSDPLPMGSFVATPTLVVNGFPGNLYRAASACHCPPMSQLLKRNNRLRVTFENTGSDDAIVRLTFAGCFHAVDECPPGRSIDRIRSLEPTIGPLLIPQRDYCPPEEKEVALPPAAVPQAAPAAAPQAGGILQVPLPHGGGVVSATPGTPTAYLSKYYQRAPGGGVTAPNAAAHGYTGIWATQRGLQGMNGLGSQYQLQPGQVYWDPVAEQWRRA